MNKWKVVFFVFLVISLFQVATIFSSDAAEAVDVAGVLFSLFILIPYYGYAFQKAVGTSVVWKYVCGLFIFFQMLIWGIVLLTALRSISGGISFSLLLVFVLTPLMAYVAITPLYRYGFKSRHLWSGNSNE